MKATFSALVLFLLMSAGSVTASDVVPPKAGRFRTYVLAMSYMNDFCVSHPTKKECLEGSDSVGSTHVGMVLHGLWPNKKDDPQHTYQYCSLSEEKFGKDWCATDTDVRSQLDDEEFADLLGVMPGAKSCLYNHEWYAHGSCSGMGVAEYFIKSTKLAEKFRELKNFKGFLAASAGVSVSRQQLLDALTKDLGAKTENAAVITCRKEKKTQKAYFSEVDLTLRRRKIHKFPTPRSLGHSGPFVRSDGTVVKDLGNCPADGIIITP